MRRFSDAEGMLEELRLTVLLCIRVSGYKGQRAFSVGAGKSLGHMLISVDGLCNSLYHMITRHHPPSYCLYSVIHSLVSHSNTNG